MKKTFLIILLIVCAALAGMLASRNSLYPYPPPENITAYDAKPADFAGFLLGMRRIFADISWIQTLQYYGGGGEEDVVSEQEFKKYEKDKSRHHDYGRYSHLIDMCRKTAGFDPHFTYVYLFGSASLAWNLTRYDEAVDLLNEGIKYNPRYYPLQTYAAAIAYSKTGNLGKVIENLEKAVRYDDCPFEVKLILGNIYMKDGLYEKAAGIWLEVYEKDTSPGNRSRAKEKLIRLIKQRKLPRSYVAKFAAL